MDIQSIISSGLQDILTILVGALVAFLVAYVRQHFSAKQISTASYIATESVSFVEQTAKALGITENNVKFQNALTKAKELASKVGINLSDSQWQTLLESALKTIKDQAQPIKTITSTTTPYTEDELINMIQEEVKKSAPNIPVDTITNIVKPIIEAELKRLSVNVNVVTQPQQTVEPSIPVEQVSVQPTPVVEPTQPVQEQATSVESTPTQPQQ